MNLLPLTVEELRYLVILRNITLEYEKDISLNNRRDQWDYAAHEPSTWIDLMNDAYYEDRAKDYASGYFANHNRHDQERFFDVYSKILPYLPEYDYWLAIPPIVNSV